MVSNKENRENKIKPLEFDSISAQKWANVGKIEAWVHKYLLSGQGGRTNPEFSEGLKLEKRWWHGPIEIRLSDLSPAVGTEPGMEYQVDKVPWENRTQQMAKSFSNPHEIPPLIAEYRSGELSIRDGNTRYAAMTSLGWEKCWVIIWYNTECDYQQHIQTLNTHDSQ